VSQDSLSVLSRWRRAPTAAFHWEGGQEFCCRHVRNCSRVSPDLHQRGVGEPCRLESAVFERRRGTSRGSLTRTRAA